MAREHARPGAAESPSTKERKRILVIANETVAGKALWEMIEWAPRG